MEREKKRRHAGDASDGEENDASDAESDADEQMAQEDSQQPPHKNKSATQPKEAKRLKPDASAVVEDATAASGSDVTVTKEQLSKFQSSLFAIFEEKHVQQIAIDEVRKHVTAKTALSEAEIMSCIEKMSSDNKIMLASDVLYLI